MQKYNVLCYNISGDNMIYIENKSIDPSFNFALEEYFLKNTDQSVFMIWQNEPTILIGRNQNLKLEVDTDFTGKNNIHIIRRLSGGGTVYCDLNNCQYSIIGKNTGEANSFQTFARPVVEALKKLGLDAEFTGRNDILIDGKKVSGNAQYKWRDRIIHHGTLLFGADMNLLQGSIKTRDIKFVDKSVKSVSSRIGQIGSMVDMDVQEFINYIRNNLIEFHHIKEFRPPNEAEIEAANKYLKDFPDIMNDQSSLEAKHYYAVKYPFGLVEYFVEVDGDQIENIKMAGDFFEERDIKEFLSGLKGMNINELAKAKFDIEKYILGFKEEYFINDILKAIKE